MGPVTPLLAVWDAVKKHEPTSEAVWIGTVDGPEKILVEEKNIRFYSISSGKLRRYFSFSNFTDIFRIAAGFFQSFLILKKEKPDLCVSAGGFVSVPIHWVAWFLGIPTWVHQQDARVGLANKLMAPFAKKITIALPASAEHFSKEKTLWLGNPVRGGLDKGDMETAKKMFGFKSDLPVIFFLGGGTGAKSINDLSLEARKILKDSCEIVHLWGKRENEDEEGAEKFPLYHSFVFFGEEEMKQAYFAADVVVSRAGFGTLSELAFLKKAAVIIPKPGHQEKNAEVFSKDGAALVFKEENIDFARVVESIEKIANDKKIQMEMGEKMRALLPAANPEDILEVCHGVMKKQ